MEKQNPKTQLTTTTTPPKSTAPSMASLDTKPQRNNYAVACAMLVSMATIICGYDIAVMSGAQFFIKKDLKVTDTQIEILAGVINLFSLLGWVFFYFFLPETRGRSLEDIEVLFGKKRVEAEKEKEKKGGEEGVVENKGDAEGASQENKG